MGETLWIILFLVVVLAAVLGPVATLRYLALLERNKAAHRRKDRDREAHGEDSQ